MLIFKLGYHRASVPEAMLPLITQIIPLKTVGKAFVIDDSVEVGVEVARSGITTEPEEIEAAQQQEYKSSKEMYERLYNDEQKARRALQEELDRLKKATATGA